MPRSLVSRQTVAPAVEPVTIAEAKEHLRLETSDDDAYVDSLITAARVYTEGAIGRRLNNQTWQLILPAFPGRDHITLPGTPLVSVTSVAYLDADGNSQTLSSSTDYEVDTSSRRGRVILRVNKDWPSTYGRWNDVTVTYVCGYGATATAVPEPLRQAIKLLVAQMYEHRVPEVTGSIVSKVQFAYDALISLYRMERRKLT